MPCCQENDEDSIDGHVPEPTSSEVGTTYQVMMVGKVFKYSQYNQIEVFV